MRATCSKSTRYVNWIHKSGESGQTVWNFRQNFNQNHMRQKHYWLSFRLKFLTVWPYEPDYTLLSFWRRVIDLTIFSLVMPSLTPYFLRPHSSLTFLSFCRSRCRKVKPLRFFLSFCFSFCTFCNPKKKLHNQTNPIRKKVAVRWL